MAIIKIIPIKDTFVNSFTNANKGLDEILEVGVNYATNSVSRTLIAFDTNYINDLNTIYSGSVSKQLNMYMATANTLPSEYTLELYELPHSNWINGVGNSTYNDKDGVNWERYLLNYDTNKVKILEQNYGIYDDKDIKFNLSGSNIYSYMINVQNDINLATGSTFGVNYFSKDTNTIYHPTLDYKFIDYVYDNSFSGSVITKDAITISLKNNSDIIYSNMTAEIYSVDFNLNDFDPNDFPTPTPLVDYIDTIVKYRINIGTRYTYPDRVFLKSSIFGQKKYLPPTSYYCVRDIDANYTLIDFDTNYTRISLDTDGNFFNLYTKNFETNRYYAIDIKVILNGNERLYRDLYRFKLHDI